MAGEGGQDKALVMENIQLSIQIFLIEAVVGPLVLLRIHHALFHQEFAPCMVAVPGQQSVIQIKNRERQAFPSHPYRPYGKGDSLPRHASNVPPTAPFAEVLGFCKNESNLDNFRRLKNNRQPTTTRTVP